MLQGGTSVVVVWLFIVITAQCADVYVSSTATPITPCGTEETPCSTIQQGIDTAVDGDQVLVQNGTYTSTGNNNVTFNGKRISVM
jgi:hypothetical protein